MKYLFCILSLAIGMGMANGAENARKIAERYGIDAFENVTSLKYTFEVERGGEKVVERTWIWRPQADEVEWLEEGIRYTRNTETMDAGVDQKFINDKYWLLFPFNLVWDEGVEITESGKTVAPISGVEMNKLTIAYVSDAGYTPGDAYDLYYTDDYLIKEWMFRKGGKATGRPMTWEDNVEHGGFLISTLHVAPNGTRLYFTGIEVETSK